MRIWSARALIAAAALVGLSHRALAQEGSRPNSETPTVRPELVSQLRQQLLTSGLTKDQIHARLRAAGYPENLLDAYMPDSTTMANTSQTFRALEDLGLADSTDIAALRLLQADSATRAKRDSLSRAGKVPYDSLVKSRRTYVIRADVMDSIARADSGYNVFGLDVFRSEFSRFDPNLGGPVDANYRLGPGDNLVLFLTGDVEATYTLQVTREGLIVLPQVGQLYVANLTLSQLEDLLYSRLGRVYSGVRRGAGATTRFSISLTKLHTNQIFVLGDVERPGSYQVSSTGTALTALYAAGGPTALGSLRDVQIKRGAQLVSTLDLYDYLLRGDASRDPRLETGDIVFVPPRGNRVRIVGEVVRPGTYEMKAGETLETLIAAAGNLRSDAARSRIQIQRILPPEQRVAGRERVTIDVAPDSAGDGTAPRIPLEGGDIVSVFAVSRRLRNTIEVQGNVWIPGRQGWIPGMTIADALQRAGGPKPDVFLGQVLVDRLRPDSSRVQLRASLRDSTGAVREDFALREDDIIHVFAVTDFRAERTVTVGGAVRKPGTFTYREGMTLRDLVLLAGGLKQSAYLKEAEIARLPTERGGQTTAVTLRVPLDSTYLFDRLPGQPYLGAPGLPSNAAGAPEVALRPFDNVLIMQQPNWEMQRIVSITGEVRFPGQYALRTRGERLADLIDRAGGLTSEAYPEGTVLLRKADNVGRVAIDVPKALKNRKSPDNLPLREGDDITVPVRSYIVIVKGAVNAPNVVAYVPGKDINYYVSQAGGAAQNGDRRKAYVTQPSGKRETNGWLSSAEPMPGSLVYVPVKESSTSFGWMNSLTSFLQTSITLVTTIIAVRALGR
ncbi:MAG TPA: SLBB domain-containing protein [Gemmatimonadaceae bacterium]|nr:SLBB domain-containing protein [Gemmatimonadaceae bacterium]